MRLWILTNTPSPYQVEFFRSIQASGRCELEVRFMRLVHRGEQALDGGDAGFPYRELRGAGPRKWRDEFRVHPEALREVARERRDLFVLSGHYTSITFILCALILTVLRKPWVMWLEQPWPADYRPVWATRKSVRSPVARVARQALLKTLLRMTRGVFCIGSAAAEAYRRMGAPERKLHLLPYHCDVERFARVDEREPARIRARLGFLDKMVFLYSGALIERKGVDLFLAAFQDLAPRHPNIAAVIIGDGPMRETLGRSVRTDLAPRVHFAGHVPQADLPAWFGAAKVFVFPSRHDGWGVVLNEACGAGLAIIATDSVGAARDLVRHGENGFVVPRDDKQRLVEAMLAFIGQPGLVDIYGKRSREIAASFTLERGVHQLLASATATLRPNNE